MVGTGSLDDVLYIPRTKITRRCIRERETERERERVTNNHLHSIVRIQPKASHPTRLIPYVK